MPITNTKLSGRKKAFTQQDFLDGKCTADGGELGAGHEPVQQAPPPLEPTPLEPSAEAATTAEVQPESVTTGPENNVEINVEEQTVEENANGSSDDSPEQPVDPNEGNDGNADDRPND